MQAPAFRRGVYDGGIYILEVGDLANVDHKFKALKNWQYLNGDGDFRFAEVKKLRDEADVIITNPPFSLFREFLKWILDTDKKFLVICNMNCVTYKEVFPLIMQDNIWLGNGFPGMIGFFSARMKILLFLHNIAKA